MTKLLEQAFSEAAKLADAEQDALAKWLLAEIESERRWEELWASSHEALAGWAAEAEAEYGRGETEALDPDKL